MNIPSDKKLAMFCQKAYDTSTVICGEVEVLILIFSTYQVLAHRGTEPPEDGGFKDWINNIRHLPPWYNKYTGWVHPGYLKTVKRAIPKIAQQLDKDLPLYITGHSKGAGEAPIAAKFLSELGFKFKKCVIFAPPRSIFRLSIKRYDKNFFIGYRNGSDIVTLVPLKVIGYRHPGNLIQIGDDFDIKKISASKFHSISKYINNL